jgi:hypothetical protein
MFNNTSALAWPQVNGATGYKIYRNTTNSFAAGSLLLTTIASGATLTFTDTGAATGVGLPPASVTGSGMVLQGWQGQTSDLLQAKDSTGAVLAKIDATGSLTVVNATINGTLTINGHIVTGGSTPTIAAGAAACTSPTVSVVGTDTAGTVTITTGTGCSGTGTMATVTFASAFAATPRVSLTPGDTNSANLKFYRTRSTGSFTVTAAATPTDATTYTFDYLVQQ